MPQIAVTQTPALLLCRRHQISNEFDFFLAISARHVFLAKYNLFLLTAGLMRRCCIVLIFVAVHLPLLNSCRLTTAGQSGSARNSEILLERIYFQSEMQGYHRIVRSHLQIKVKSLYSSWPIKCWLMCYFHSLSKTCRTSSWHSTSTRSGEYRTPLCNGLLKTRNGIKRIALKAYTSNVNWRAIRIGQPWSHIRKQEAK